MRPELAVEIWLPVPGLPDYYQISNKGVLCSLPYVDRRGWQRQGHTHKVKNAEISLSFGGQCRCYPLGALVLRAFVGPPAPDQYLCRHLDDNRENNNLFNLDWGTDADNRADAIRNGRSFASYGRLGKPHTEATKQLLSKLKKGVPSGRKMSDKHKAAIWAGYRKKFPEKQSQECMCGCGRMTRPGKRYLHGHRGAKKARTK